MSVVAKHQTAPVNVAFGSVGAAFADIATLGSVRLMQIYSTLDNPVELAVNNTYSTDFAAIRIPAGSAALPVSFQVPYGAVGLQASGTLRLRHAGAAPTAGSIVINFVTAP